MFDIFSVTSFVKKNISRKDVIILLLLISAFFLTRLIQLDQFPIFTDEGIYIHWAKVAWHDASWRFISLTDGRQPLQTWATIPFLKLSGDNLLFGGRLFGVFSGLFGLTGLWLVLRHVFGKRAAHIGTLLYIMTPFFLFFDRLAMIDSLVNASAIWIFYFSILLVQTLRLDVALCMGFLSGLFLLAKSNVSMFLALSITAPILTAKKLLKPDVKKTINYLFLYGIVIVISILIYNIQRLSPFFQFVGGKNTTFVLTISEFLHNPFQVFWYNLWNIPLYTAHNLGWATFIFGLLGYGLLFKKNRSLAIYAGIWVIAIYIFMSFFMRVLFSRYHIFLLMFFVVFASYFFDQFYEKITQKIPYIVLIVLAYLFTFYFSFTVMFDYAKIPFLPTDRGQYIEGWPAGWGAREIMDYARNESTKKPVIIVGEGNFGMTGDVLDTFLKKTDTQLSIHPFWPLGEKELRDTQKDLDTHTVLVVFAHRDEYPPEWPLELIRKFEKPNNKSALYLFRLTK